MPLGDNKYRADITVCKVDPIHKENAMWSVRQKNGIYSKLALFGINVDCDTLGIMSAVFKFQQFISKLLLASILLQAVAPAFAELEKKSEVHWSEVCTSLGAKWVKVSLEADDQSPSKHALNDHCVFCASTGAVDKFDSNKFLPPSTFSKFQFSQSINPVASYAGHSIRSRAPPL